MESLRGRLDGEQREKATAAARARSLEAEKAALVKELEEQKGLVAMIKQLTSKAP